MVAQLDSCACADCGAVCHGKFPGCATVWAAGPRHVMLSRTVSQLPPPRALPVVSSSNGKAAPETPSPPPSLPAPSSALPVTVALPLTEPGVDVAALLLSLRSELKALHKKVDRLQEKAGMAEELALAAIRATEESHQQTGRALQEQHGAIVNDLLTMRRQVATEVRQMGDALLPPREDPSTAALIEHIDTRLEWLVGEISHRLVILGNEMVRIDERIGANNRQSPLASNLSAPTSHLDEAGAGSIGRLPQPLT